jgi:hypothetical protein
VGPSLLPRLATGGVGFQLQFGRARVVSDGSGGNRLNLVRGGLLAAVGSRRPHGRQGPAACSCAAGSCGALGACAPRGSRATVVALPAAGSSAAGSCGKICACAPHVQAAGSAEASCTVGSAGDSVPCGGLVRSELQRRARRRPRPGGGLMRGELQWQSRRPCAVSSRRAHARRRPRLSAAGSALPASGRAAQMAWSWGWRHQDLEASMSVVVGVGLAGAALQ